MSPYLHLIRFDRPTGTLLLLFPCIWGLILASAPELPDKKTVALFVLGAFLLRSAGCIINDWWDRDIDRQTQRTRQRPLASGALSTSKALATLLVLLVLGLIILLQFSFKTILLGLAAMPLVALYPLAKRHFAFPQLVLGLVFNWGALLAPMAVTGRIPLSCWWLYAACVCWTLYYDTVYAVQDMDDDRKSGVRSSALTLGNNIIVFLAVTATLFACLLRVAAQSAGLSFAGWFFALMTALLLPLLKKDARRYPQNLQAELIFKGQMGVGALVTAALLF